MCGLILFSFEELLRIRAIALITLAILLMVTPSLYNIFYMTTRILVWSHKYLYMVTQAIFNYGKLSRRLYGHAILSSLRSYYKPSFLSTHKPSLMVIVTATNEMTFLLNNEIFGALVILHRAVSIPQVLFSMDNGKGDEVLAKYTPPAKNELCNGEWHTIRGRLLFTSFSPCRSY